MPSTRAVIEVSLMDDGKGKLVNVFKVVEAYNTPVQGVISPLTCTPDDAIFDMSTTGSTARPFRVADAGRSLCDVLAKSPDAMAMFVMSSQISPGVNPPPVFLLLVKLDAPDAERLPWEALWRQPPGGFLALHPGRQWPIARMVAGAARPLPLTRTAGPTLRVAMVLAAAGQNGLAEWQAFQAPLAATQVPVELLVVVSDDGVNQTIQSQLDTWASPAAARANAAAAGGAAAPARSGNVVNASDQIALLSMLQAFSPNVVHIFCHGVADPRPRLEIETRNDRRRGEPTGSIRLDATTLSPLAATSSVWLMVLNCCQGGKPATNLHSLARDLVIAGTPAVVAMRESVNVVDANLFSAELYQTLLPELGRVLSSGQLHAAGAQGYAVPETLWAGALFDARQRLGTTPPPRDPSSSPEWTYPVMYVNRDELRLVWTVLAAALDDDAEQGARALRSTLEVLQQVRTTMPPTADAAALATIDAKISEVRQKLGLPAMT